MKSVEYAHNSRLTQYRAPFGAICAGETVRLFIEAPIDAGVRLRLWVDGGERIITGERTNSGVSFAFAPEHTGLIWYYFLLDTPQGLMYYGGSHGLGEVYDYPPPSYQLTVYDKSFTVPRWFTNGIVYQIFPDRFNRGSARGGLERVSSHEDKGRRVIIHEDWDEDVNYRALPGETDYDPCDFFGGDLKGIEDKLTYLESLGVTCIYLNPVFESRSNHRYDVSDYMACDPMLGGDKALASLASRAKEHGMRIMLDGVFSHTGADSRYFDISGIYGGGAYHDESSPYAPWYTFTSRPDNYRCWWGFKSLPEINECNSSYMRFIGEVIERWAAIGITSWRLDVADELPDEFIEFLRNKLKSIDPEGVLLGEVWEDCSNKSAYGVRRKYVDGDELDSAMCYPFREAVTDFLLYRTDANGLYERFMAQRENYPRPFYNAQLNLLGSHDTVRILTVLSGAPHRDALTREEQALYVSSDEQLERGRARLIIAAALMVSMPGVPCIYYGDEAGARGMADPFSRRTYPWGHEDAALIDACKRLMRAHSVSSALKRGACAFAPIGDDVFAIMRTLGSESAVTLINRSADAKNVVLSADMLFEGPDAARMFISDEYRDALSGYRVHCDNEKLRIVLPPMTGAVLIGDGC